MAVSVRTGPRLVLEKPKTLFELPPALRESSLLDLRAYSAAPDGQRFLMNAIKEDASTSPITIVQNWKPLQK